jgi:hypothetical protein
MKRTCCPLEATFPEGGLGKSGGELNEKYKLNNFFFNVFYFSFD